MESNLSIQDSINEAKKEFSSDEKMLASAFKIEKFYKNNKIKIFSVVALTILFFGGNGVMGVIEEGKLNTANDAYLILTKDANNTEALATLQSNNPALFELFNYKKAIDNNDTTGLKALISSENSIISDMSRYHLAVIEGTSVESELYGDVALINNANLLIKEGKMGEAKEQLALIDEQSPVHNIATIIKHYTIKGQ